MIPTEDQPCKDCQRTTTDRDYRIQTFTANGEYLYTLCRMCARNRKDEEYDRTGVITTSLWMDRHLDHLSVSRKKQMEDPLLLAMEGLQQLTRKFEAEVWFHGLQKIIQDCDSSGMELKSGDLQILTLCTAGRVMLTLSNPAKDSISLITTDEDEDRPRMGIQGICATAEVATGLIEQAITAWQAGARPEASREVYLV